MYNLFFYNDPREQSKSTNRVILFSTILLVLFCLAILVFTYAQNNALRMDNGTIVLNGGTSTNPIYFVINQPNQFGIVRNSGAIISDGEFSRLKWNIRTATGNFEFPFGTTSAYVPLKLNITSAGTESGTGSFTVSSWYTASNAVWPNGTSLCGTATENDVTDRFWVITPDGYSTNPTSDVYFYYNATAELDGISETELQMQRWNPSCCGASTCKWETPPVGTAVPASDYVLVSSLSGFSPWAMIRQSAPLPIELLYFKARWKDPQYTAVQLEWETAIEINNDYFEIQRSKDAVNFSTIKTVPGAGNSSQVISYTVYDTDPEKEATSYYRLKQVDYDGKYSYSNIEALNAPSDINLITIYPNPSKENVDFLVYSSEDSYVSVWAIDVAGKLVISEKRELKKGVNKQRLKISHLSNGNYVLQLSANENVKTEKQFVIH